MKRYIVNTNGNEFVFGIHDYSWKDKDDSKFDKEFQSVIVCLKKKGQVYEVLCVDYTSDVLKELVWEPLWNQLGQTDKVLIFLYNPEEPISQTELKNKLLIVEEIMKPYFERLQIPSSDL